MIETRWHLLLTLIFVGRISICGGVLGNDGTDSLDEVGGDDGTLLDEYRGRILIGANDVVGYIFILRVVENGVMVRLVSRNAITPANLLLYHIFGFSLSFFF